MAKITNVLSPHDQAVIDAIIADALPDEPQAFFGKLHRAIKRVAHKAAKKVAPIAKKLAPFAGGVIGGAKGGPAGAVSGISPYVPMDVQASRLHAHLQAEDASDDDIFDAFAVLAVHDTRSLPIIAGLGARTILDGTVSSRAVRRRVVIDVGLAAEALIARRGPKAVRALPKIIRSTKRTAGSGPRSRQAQARSVRLMAMKVAQSPRITAQLLLPEPKLNADRTLATERQINV